MMGVILSSFTTVYIVLQDLYPLKHWNSPTLILYGSGKTKNTGPDYFCQPKEKAGTQVTMKTTQFQNPFNYKIYPNRMTLYPFTGKPCSRLSFTSSLSLAFLLSASYFMFLTFQERTDGSIAGDSRSCQKYEC